MNKKILSSLIIAIITMVMISNIANALSFTASMTASNTTVPEATEFTITVKVSNLDVGTNGINTLKGYLKYDTDVFETINDSSIDGLNQWVANYESSTGKISLTKSTFVTTSQEVFQVTLKTKSGVSGSSGSIQFSNITASNSESEIPATDISTTITIGSSTEATNTVDGNSLVSNITVITANTVENTTNNVVNNTVNNVVNNTTENVANNTVVSTYVNTITNTQTDKGSMPYTGVNDTLFMVILGMVAVALLFYIKFEKLNNDIK